MYRASQQLGSLLWRSSFAKFCAIRIGWSMQISKALEPVPQQGMCPLQGIDVIWESVGGDMFRTCTRALGQGGRLIVIGMMSQYADGWGASEVTSCVILSATALVHRARGGCLPA